MSSHAAAVVRSACLALLLAAAAACGASSGTPPPTVGDQPVAATAPTRDATQPPSATPRSTPTPRTASEPPAAMLDGLRGEPPDGDLGTFSWDGLVSDAPWITGGSGGTTTPGTGLAVTFDPETEPPADWRARWAKVTQSGPGTPMDGGTGAGAAIELVAPDRAGSWSLQLTASFGAGRSATWYWQVDVVKR
jgi:hypothetical protein